MKQNGIIQEPNNILHEVSEKVTNFAEARKIAQELIEVTKSNSNLNPFSSLQTLSCQFLPERNAL